MSRSSRRNSSTKTKRHDGQQAKPSARRDAPAKHREAAQPGRNPATMLAAIVGRLGGFAAGGVRTSTARLRGAFAQDRAAATIATVVLLFAIGVPVAIRYSDRRRADALHAGRRPPTPSRGGHAIDDGPPTAQLTSARPDVTPTLIKSPIVNAPEPSGSPGTPPATQAPIAAAVSAPAAESAQSVARAPSQPTATPSIADSPTAVPINEAVSAMANSMAVAAAPAPIASAPAAPIGDPAPAIAPAQPPAGRQAVAAPVDAPSDEQSDSTPASRGRASRQDGLDDLANGSDWEDDPNAQEALSVEEPPIRVRWLVHDRVIATARLNEWLAHTRGSTISVERNRWVVQLPASSYPDLIALLEQLGKTTLDQQLPPLAHNPATRRRRYIIRPASDNDPTPKSTVPFTTVQVTVELQRP